MISVSEIKKIISHLDFLPEDGKDNIFYKKYKEYDNYIIRVNFQTKKIEYRTDDIDELHGIKLGDATTSNFSNSENFVVLECVDRILKQGYKPQSITLEKKYSLGRKLKGKLDIRVSELDNDEKTYFMIECKTWGKEFDKEQKKMLRDGGQLFSYYTLDRATQYLCLYTSRISEEGLEWKNEIVPIDESWRELSTTKEIHDHWNKNFKDNGIFEEWITAYNVDIKALVRGKLQPITKDDSGKIFNQFAEILRHNVVSDKPNAFNKILNLFICKIIDEDRNDDEQVEFQWLEDDDDQSLQLRLNDLYKKGMRKFLNIDVTDYTEKDIEDNLISLSDDDAKKALQQIFTKLRLQKNPEFAFIEVYDDASFQLNARVVREVVELLQPYRFRYGHKQQFLGDFFERLLNTSMKQEAGQFFTPTPIAHYIISCLPIKELIVDKLQNGSADGILPTAIDFACGTGHFLTEYMDIVQNIIENIDVNIARPRDRRKLLSWHGDNDEGKYEWAGEYVYGIDADYRLIKSSKVSSFLNGDGEANIIRANGLDHFKKSNEYKGKLTYTTSDDRRNNAQFDILIANPPYSVNAFKSTVQYGEESFELFPLLTDNSSEIECLFIERMKQLLKVDGYAGIILPSSILSNTGIGTAAREIILKYFYIVGITQFSSNTFMATNTKTITMFLKRRDNAEWRHIEKAVHSFFDKPKDVTVFGIEKAFTKYVDFVYDNINIEDYISFVRRQPTQAFMRNEKYEDYIVWFHELTDIINLKKKKSFTMLPEAQKKQILDDLFYDKVFNIEKEKLLYFFITYKQKTVIVQIGEEKQAAKTFLGYEFSNSKGHEGIKLLPSGTKLYDDICQNKKKANYYIYNAFLGKYDDIDDSLKDNIYIQNTYKLLDIQNVIFKKSISMSRKEEKNLMWNTHTLQSLSKIADIQKGNTITKSQTKEGNIPVVAGGMDIAYYHDTYNREAGVITISASGANAGYVNFWNVPIFASDCNTVISLDENIVLTKYIYECLKIIQPNIYNLQKGQAQPHVYAKDLENIKIPVPTLAVQQKIVNEIDKLEILEKENKKEIFRLNGALKEKRFYLFEEERLDRIAELIKRGKSAKYGKSDIQIIKSGQARGYLKFDFSTRYYVSENFISDDRNLQRGDILINSTGVGTAGRVTLFDLEGNFVVDSHITIVRLNQQKALPKYVLYALAYFGFDNIEKLATGQSGQIELGLDTIKNIKIPLPPMGIQKKIVDEIEAIEEQMSILQSDNIKINEQKQAVVEQYLL